MKICFICHGNICRSFMAQELLRYFALKNNLEGFSVISRGVYAQSHLSVPQKIKDFLQKQGITYSGHEPVLVSKEDADSCAFLFPMTQEQLDYLTDKYPQHSDKMYLFLDFALGLEKDMEDPISLSGRAFDKCAVRLKTACAALFNKIKNPS